jgi:hypothetical protein
VFDETRPWDLALFAPTLMRGKQEGLGDDSLRDRLEAFVDQFLRGRVQGNLVVYDSLLSASRGLPELLNEEAARTLSLCCLEVLSTDVDKLFADLRYLVTKMSASNRLWLARQVIDVVLSPRQAQWIQVLQKLAEDVAKDDALSSDKKLVADLVDYAFEAARQSPSEGSSVFSVLIPLVSADSLPQHIDEALDRLLTLESSGGSTAQMDPYFSLLRNAASALDQRLREKTARFSLRMLGTAKTDEEKTATLQFVHALRSALLEGSLRERVQELSEGEGTVAETARQTLDIAADESPQETSQPKSQ